MKSLGLLLASLALFVFACDSEQTPTPDPTNDVDAVEEVEPELVEELAELPEELEELPEELEELPPPCLCEAGQCGTLDCGTECGGCASGFTCTDNACERRCDQNLELVNELAFIQEDAAGFSFRFSAVTGHSVPYQALVIEFAHQNVDGPVPTGLFDAAYNKFGDCTYCMYLRADYVDGDTSKLLIPVQGQIDIRLMSKEGGYFSINLKDVVFAEVAYYSATKIMPLVKDGMQVCVPDHTATVTVETQHDSCAVLGTGPNLGDNIADFHMQNCNGEWVNLHSFCGSKAVWLVAVATWCSACKEYVPVVQSYYDIFHADGLEVRYILGEDGDSDQPDLADCMTYATRNNLPPEMVLIDWTKQWGGWSAFFSNINPYIPASGEFGIPWEAMLDGRTMRYVYSDKAPDTGYRNVLAAMNDLLSK